MCDVCGRQMVIKSGRFGRFLACPGYPECTFTKPLVIAMPGRCPKCGGRILKKTSRNGYAYYGCEHNSEKDESKRCDFMTWDVPVADDCPVCGQTNVQEVRQGVQEALLHQRELFQLHARGQAGRLSKKTAASSAEGEGDCVFRRDEEDGCLYQEERLFHEEECFCHQKGGFHREESFFHGEEGRCPMSGGRSGPPAPSSVFASPVPTHGTDGL